jgi:thioredoxin-related protein
VNQRRRQLLLAAACLGVGAAARARTAGREEHLPSIEDMRPLLAQVRRQRTPLLVLFSTPGCPFCGEVRNNYLAPRVREQVALATPDLIIREVDITSRSALIDQEGRSSTQAGFAAQFGVKVVPVVVLFDDRLQLLAEPLVGIDRSGFYEGYLQRAVDQAQRRLRA